MIEPVRCASCGLPLDPPGPGGLCPVCLLKMGLEAAEGPDTAGAPTSAGPAAGAMPGTIGPYHLLQVIGEGGMGLVYLAEQRQPLVRRVALKLIKPGMDTREVLARFEAERQTLALMDHPNIARVLDAGLGPGGRPYFVMEYVAGIPITDYCDRHRLRNAERLQIFLQVCAALQHAHQKGIIHRDLKPSNILVTVQDGKPVPKVIDFGIAKATRQSSLERAAFTQLGMLIGTPEYISPEQAEAGGLEVDTTTDIYSLGVVLYELLTGVLPFDGDMLRQAGYAEMHRIIREQDPPKPSLRVTALGATAAEAARHRQTTQPALGKQLRGDLDAIAMKAMEKDRTRRYASASEFAADIARYLHGEAVVASPPSVLYRTRKFVRRHRVGVAAALAVVLALAAGLVVSTGLYLRAEASRQETERQRAVADRQTCVANLAAAEAAIRSNQGGEARRRLRACPVGLRNWEWHHLWSRTDPSIATIGSRGGTPTAVSVTPDGARVLWLTENGVLRAADLSSRLPIPDYRYPPVDLSAPQSMIAVSDDGSRGIIIGRAIPSIGAVLIERASPPSAAGQPRAVREPFLELTAIATHLTSREARFSTAEVIASSDTPARRMLTVIDLGRWQPLSSLELPSLGVSAPIDFRPVRADRTSRAWRSDEPVSFQRLFESDVVLDLLGRSHARMSGRTGSTVSATFSRDGHHVATWTWEHVVRVWNVESGKAEAALAGHRDGISQVVFSPDGSRVASASHDGTVRVWPLASPAAVTVLSGHESAVLAVGFSPDGRRIAAGGADGYARVWDISGRELVRLAGHQDLVTAVAFSPDGARVATGSVDRTVRLWESTTGRLEDTLRGHTGEVACVAFSPDGRTVVSGATDQTVRLWDAAHLASARVPYVAASAVRLVAWSSNPARLFGASADGSLQSWNPENPWQVQRWPGPDRSEPMSRFGEVSHLAASSDGTRIATAARDGAIAVWQPANGTVPTVLRGPESSVAALTMADDGSLVAAALGSGRVRVWDASSGRLLASWGWRSGQWSWRPGEPRGLSFSPDLKALAGGSGNAVVMWDRTRGVPIRTFVGPDSPMTVTRFSPDGRLIACGYRDGSVHLWSVADGTPAGVLRGDSGVIWSLAFDPTGSRLATESVDGVVRIWDVAARESLLLSGGKPRTADRPDYSWAVDQPGHPWGVAFDGDGRRLLAAGPDAVVNSFDTWTAYPAAASEAVESASEADPLPDSVIRRLSEDRALTAATRQMAIRLAQARGADPDTLYARCWSIVRRAGGDAASYEQAVRLAEAAVAMAPFKRELVDAHGVALYRAGRYRDSLAVLTRAAALRGTPDWMHLLMMAMCHQRLGANQQAQAAIERARSLPPFSWLHPAEDTDAWLQEAEALMSGGAAKPGVQR